MSAPTNSGIRTTTDGTSYIPSSKRADGTTRKEIRVRPGWTPQEDVKTYKSRNAEAWRSRGSGGVPGAETTDQPTDLPVGKSKNAKRRDAARKKTVAETDGAPTSESDAALNESMGQVSIGTKDHQLEETSSKDDQDAEMERQKKIRNQLKKLKAVRELRTKKANGDKLSPDQLMKLGKEAELLRDLKKMGYEESESATENQTPALAENAAT